MQDDNNVDLQQEAKELVLKELESSGVIGEMRAKIKKSIIDIINNQKESTKQKLDFDFMTPLHRLNKPKEIMLVCQLIKEFLKFYEMEYTLPIFENESNVKENIKRETLLKELKLQDKKDDPKPVLLLLLQDKLNRKEDPLGGGANRNPLDRLNRYDFGAPFSKDDSSGVIPNRKGLSPISFDNNKSLDMASEDKFNTFNISDAYKRPTQPPADKKEEDKKKEITSADILGGGDKRDVKAGGDVSKDNKVQTGKFSIGGKDDNPDKYDDEFKEEIPEVVDEKLKTSQEKKGAESQSFSTSNVNSQGLDSTAGGKNNFDFVESAEKV